MNRYIIAAAAVVLCAAAAPAHANPSLSFTWNGCSGPIQQASGGPGTYSLYVSATGVEAPHQAYEAFFDLATAEGDVPDAWRFDETGCPGTGAIKFCPPSPLDAPALSETCSPMWGKGRFLVIHGIRPAIATDDPVVPPNSLVFGLMNAYDPIADPDPNQTYFLYRVDFDHTHSVEGAGTPGETCGGFEHDMYVRPILSRCAWLTVLGPGGLGNEVLFDVTQAYARFGDKEPAPAGGTTPAASSTWGQVKAQYRR